MIISFYSLLHVILKIQSVRFLVWERVGLCQSMIEDNVDTRFRGFVGTFVGFFGRRIETSDIDGSGFAGDELANN